jgi:hypothetical protein
MRRPAVRFALACLLFAGWLGYLIFLAFTSTRPVVLSRPQMLVSQLDVVAKIDNLDQPVVEVEQVLSVARGVKAPAKGQSITVNNLKDCKRVAREDEDANDVPLDWTGPGLYLLPLDPDKGDSYKVVVVPSSPGFPVSHRKVTPPKPTPRLYPATEDALRQYRQIKPEA